MLEAKSFVEDRDRSYPSGKIRSSFLFNVSRIVFSATTSSDFFRKGGKEITTKSHRFRRMRQSVHAALTSPGFNFNACYAGFMA